MDIHETKDEYWFPNGHITVGRHIIIEGVSDDMIKLAHLLEAAPDLLTSLRRMCELYDAMGAPRGPCRIIADAVIEKAEGGI